MNNKLLVSERSRDIGNFLVGRLLPFAKKRQVGPFTFIDHMGPSTLGPDHFMDVDMHPHIGLSTLTYLFEGEIEHRDSTGAVQVVKPGDVGFMTAGKGVTHTERTPRHLRKGTYTAHGYQVWVAMPEEMEEMDPVFEFVPGHELPSKTTDDLELTVVAGRGFGLTSPLKVWSPLFMVSLKALSTHRLDLRGELKGEIAVVVVNGEVKDGKDTIGQGEMLISKTDDECCLDVGEGTELLLFGGKPFDKERFLLWNFASSSKERLQQAAHDWMDRKFPKVPGDETYIPLPEKIREHLK